LLMMNKEAARTTLKTASRSIFRGIRLAYKRAVEESVTIKMRG
jgi:ABC-type phosphate transport system permease subunit